MVTIDPGDSIQTAINGSSSGDTIVLNPGTYSENGLTITAKNLTFRAADGHGPSDTIIDGMSAAPRIFTVLDASSLIIENLTLRNGRAGDGARGSEGHWFGNGGHGGAGGSGGAIFSNGPVSIISSSITGSSAGNGGDGGSAGWAIGNGGNGGAGGSGGAICAAGPVLLAASIIGACSAGDGGDAGHGGEIGGDGTFGSSGDGGAIYSKSTVVLTSSMITLSSAGNGGRAPSSGGPNGNGGNGGAIFATGAVTLTSSGIRACAAGVGADRGLSNGGNGGSGGAIYATGSVALTNSSITGSAAGNGGIAVHFSKTGGAGGSGGAIYSTGPVSLTTSSITGSWAGAGGLGGADKYGGIGGSGGAIFARDTVALVASDISCCSAGNGGDVDGGEGGPRATAGSGGSGGAIWAPGVTLDNATISCCSAGTGGWGGKHQGWAADGNNAGDGGNGGAIYAPGMVSLAASAISGCSGGNGGTGGSGGSAAGGGNGGNGGDGGAIYAPGMVSLAASTIAGCSAGTAGIAGSGGGNVAGTPGDGGAVFTSAEAIITISTLTGCSAGGNGGAVFVDSGPMTVDASGFTDCAAGGNGGAIYAYYGPVTVTDSSFSGCSAGTNGGAIYTYYEASATSSTFIGCEAACGSAIYGRGGPVNFCRLIGNTGTTIDSPGRSYDATLNWWGVNSNPSAQVSSVVVSSPWLVLGGTATPDVVAQDQASTIEANLTYDSEGIWHDPAHGHVPDGIPVVFAVVSGPGSVSPGSAATAEGAAQATFTSPAIGTATVTTGVDGQTVSALIQIEPAAAFEVVDRSVVRQQQAAQFIDRSESSLPLTYAWDFGDGSRSMDRNPLHIYRKEGVYTVTLTVTSAIGSDTLVKENCIFVTSPNPIHANFAAEKKVGSAPLEVSFTDTSKASSKIPSYPAIDSWLWDFGDGSLSTEQNPGHFYQDAGSYTVTLTVSNSVDSATKTKEDFITVSKKREIPKSKKYYIKIE